jgi:hypothetical protein
LVHLAERRLGRQPKKRVKVPGIRTERERSGAGRSGYVPRSRSYASNLKRKLRKSRPANVRRTKAPATAGEQFDDAHRMAKRGIRGSRVKRSSVYDRPEAYYRKSRGGPAGGFIEGNLGETAVRARRGGHGDQNRRTQSIANVKNKPRGGS